jgi:hypothetical protein
MRKYLVLLFLVLAAWFVIEEFVLRDRGSQGLHTYREKWKDLARSIHMVFGILAGLIVALMVVRLVMTSFWQTY